MTKCEKECLTYEYLNQSKRKLIRDCDISLRVSNAIETCGFIFLDELKNISAEELREKYRGIGNHTIREIRILLANYGMNLKGDILCNSEDEKKLILDMPKTISEIMHVLRDVERRISFLSDKLDRIKANMQSK